MNSAATGCHAEAAATHERSPSDPAWHTQSVNQVLQAFATTTSGLTAGEAARRLSRYGPNELQILERASAWHTLAAQFKNVLILILLTATLAVERARTRTRSDCHRASSCCSPCCLASSRSIAPSARWRR